MIGDPCSTCGRPHELRRGANGKPTWAAPDGHKYVPGAAATPLAELPDGAYESAVGGWAVTCRRCRNGLLINGALADMADHERLAHGSER